MIKLINLHVIGRFPLQRPRYAPHPSYACTAPLFTSRKYKLESPQKARDVIQYNISKALFLFFLATVRSKSIMSRENLHVSYYFSI